MANIQIDISENGKTTLATRGKYCDRNVDVNVDVVAAEKPTEFTNVLKHESTVVMLNKAGSSHADNSGKIVVELDLVALGYTKHPAELTFRWRGMHETGASYTVYISTDKTSWLANCNLFSAVLDEHGDFSLYRRVDYPSANRYVLLTFEARPNAQVVTQEDVDKCILTINEPIGNGGYVEPPAPVAPLLDVSQRTYTPHTGNTIFAADTRELDPWKCYTTQFTGARSASISDVLTYTTVSNNSLSISLSGSASSGYGVEFPVPQMEVGKTYTLKFSSDQEKTPVYLIKYNADTTYNTNTRVEMGVGTKTVTITPEEGFIYSILFAVTIADTVCTYSDISLTEN